MVQENLSSMDNVHIDVIDDQDLSMSEDWRIDDHNSKAFEIINRETHRFNPSRYPTEHLQ